MVVGGRVGSNRVKRRYWSDKRQTRSLPPDTSRCSNYIRDAFAARAPPQITLGELRAPGSPNPKEVEEVLNADVLWTP